MAASHKDYRCVTSVHYNKLISYSTITKN
uniref:Uncharacterized protein n=1 Tax=Anguilla anguilla TaxID=7936 RepID=A0A0E9SZG2_ANGAN